MSRILSVACLALVLLAGVAPSASRPVRSRGHLHALRAWGSRGRHGPGVHGGRQRRERHLVESGRLAFLRGHDISVTHSQLVPGLADDVSWSYPVYAQHVEGWGGPGASVGYLSYGQSEATDEEGNVTGTFTSYELVPAIAYGTELADNLGFGVALKLIRVDLAPATVTLDGRAGRGTTFAADLGALVKMPGPAPRSVPSSPISDLDIAYIDEDQSDPLGRNIRVGAAYTPFENDVHRVLVAADASRFLIPGRVLAVDAWNADSNTSSTGSSPSAADTSAIPSATSRTGRSDWG